MVEFPRYPNIVDMESAGSLGALEGFIMQGAAWLEPNLANTTPAVNHVSTAVDWPVACVIRLT